MCLAHRPAIGVGLNDRFDPHVTGKQTAHWYTCFPERLIVGSSVENRRIRAEPGSSEIVKEHLLDLPRPVGIVTAEDGAIPVVHEPCSVGRARHVNVQIKCGSLRFAGGQLSHVMVRAFKAVLFSAPESESHTVARLRRGLRKPPGDFEHRCDPTAVVVNSRTIPDRVEMTSYDDRVVRAACGVRQYIERLNKSAATPIPVCEHLPYRGVTSFPQDCFDIFGGFLVTGRPGRPSTVVGVGNLLQCGQVHHVIGGFQSLPCSAGFGCRGRHQRERRRACRGPQQQHGDGYYDPTPGKGSHAPNINLLRNKRKRILVQAPAGRGTRAPFGEDSGV